MNRGKDDRRIENQIFVLSDLGAPTPIANESIYGPNIELDQTWTVRHAFSGTVACLDRVTLSGMSHSDATDATLALNIRHLFMRRISEPMRSSESKPA
jgi:hypothetical protein